MGGFILGSFLFGVLFLCSSASSLYRSWADLFHRMSDARQLRKTALFTIGEMQGIVMDGWVKTSGTLSFQDGQVIAPLSGKSCTYWKVEVEVEDRNSKGNNTYSGDSNMNLLLSNKQRSIPVQIEHILVTGDLYQQDEGFSRGLPYQLSFGSDDDKGMAVIGMNLPKDLNEQSVMQYKTKEYIIPPECPAVILAQVGQDSDGSRFLHASAEHRGTMIISSDTEIIDGMSRKKFLWLYKDLKTAMYYLALSLACFAASAAALFVSVNYS